MKIVNNKIEIDIDELDAAVINKLINFFQIPTNEISNGNFTFEYLIKRINWLESEMIHPQEEDLY